MATSRRCCHLNGAPRQHLAGAGPAQPAQHAHRCVADLRICLAGERFERAEARGAPIAPSASMAATRT
jgi:hypothetical protein